MSDITERFAALERDNVKIRGLLGEVSGVVWGDMVTRSNGLRSRVVALEKESESFAEAIESLESRVKHFAEVDRRETCYGLAGLAKFEAQCSESEREETDVTVATMQAEVQKSIARNQTIGIIVNAIVSACALVAVAIISRGGL